MLVVINIVVFRKIKDLKNGVSGFSLISLDFRGKTVEEIFPSSATLHSIRLNAQMNSRPVSRVFHSLLQNYPGWEYLVISNYVVT